MPKSKKKSKKISMVPSSTTPAKVVSSVPPVALLVDGENVNIPDLLVYILVEAGKMGGVTVRQVYGNWAAPSMQSWKKLLNHYSLEPIGNRPGANATDIALVIGAMDLLYQGIKHFCLVAGDSDYVPLVERLRRDGCTVLVIGTSAVSNALKNACNVFTSTDQLIPPKSSPSHTPPASSPSQNQTTLQIQPLCTLLTDACRVAAQQSGSEWISLSALGMTLRQENPTFEQTYGKKSLSTLVQQCSGYLETRKTAKGKGLIEEVRLHP